MGRTTGIAARILFEQAETERVLREKVARMIERGPAVGSGVSAQAWRDWWKYGFVTCPGEKRDLTCEDPNCRIGAACAKMAEKGLRGDGQELPRNQRPACGARTRAGGECRMKVEPGKRRCRLHGGKSTGPKTAEGRARIAEAQRRRWAAYRDASIHLSSDDR